MMHIALIPVLMEEFKLSTYEAGLLVSIPRAISILASLPYGLIADRVDPRKLIALSLLITGFSGLSASHSWNFVTLLASISFIPLSSTIYHPPALKIVSETFPNERQSKALGIHGAGGTMGVAIGPVTLGLMLDKFGWRFSYLVWCIPVVLSALLTYTLPRVETTVETESAGEESSPNPVVNRDKGLTAALRRIERGYLLLLMAMGINSMGQQALSAYMTTYLVSVRGLSESNASLLFGLNPFIGILGSLVGGYLSSKLGSKNWLFIAYISRVFVYSGIWLSPFWMLVPIYLTGGFFGGSTLAPSTTLVAIYSPRKRRGLAYTIFMLLPSLVGSVSPLIAAWLIETYDITGLFPFAMALTFSSALVLQTLPKRK